ncbi:MAG: GNAT family N-acetyltransferase [Clostridia bacterium]|nr:GNAT family N-acetyltransferase [Clostridia bacterium]
MTLNQSPTAESLSRLRSLYERAFPPSEKKPWRMIEERVKLGTMRVVSIEEDGVFLGLMIFIIHRDIVLLDYFAVEESARGRGIGGRALEILFSHLGDFRLLLEIEDTDDKSAENLSERLRRRDFYLRHGMKPMSYKVDLFGVRMNLLTYEGRGVTFEEYHEIFRSVFSPKIAENVKLC